MMYVARYKGTRGEFIHAHNFVLKLGRNGRKLSANALLSCLLARELLEQRRSQLSTASSGIEAATNNKGTIHVSVFDPSVGEWLIQLLG
jgi:hypothetical protein